MGNKAGRPPGAVNRPKRAIVRLLEEQFPGYNAVVEMARIANDDSNDLSTRLSAHKEVAQYTMPKLKAVEVQLEGQVNATIGWSDPHRVQSETPSSEPA